MTMHRSTTAPTEAPSIPCLHNSTSAGLPSFVDILPKNYLARNTDTFYNFVSHFEFLSQNSNPAWPVVAIPESSNLHVPVLDVRRMVRFIPYQFEGHDKGNSTIDITSLTPLINLYFPCIALYQHSDVFIK